jgi:hypothetical protein
MKPLPTWEPRKAVPCRQVGRGGGSEVKRFCSTLVNSLLRIYQPTKGE